MKKIFFFSVAMLLSVTAYPQWIQQNSGTTNMLIDVHFINENIGFAVGHSGTFLKTTDGGENWTSQNVGFAGSIRSIHFPSANVGYFCGAGGTVFRTPNGGVSWFNITPDPQYTNNGADLHSIYFTSETEGFAVGRNGTIIKGEDGGQVWSSISSGTTHDLNKIVFGEGTHNGHIAGNSGVILRTSNSGANWAAQTSGTSQNLLSIDFANSAIIAYAVGTQGAIRKTSNSGDTWGGQTSNTTAAIYDVKFVTQNIGYACALDGKILKTTNGSTWTAESTSNTNPLIAIFPVNENVAYAVGANGTILKRTTAVPGNAGTITGQTTVCQGTTNVVYSLEAIPNAETYHWSLPSGATGVSTTNTISVDFGTNAVSGNISVYASNVNGNGNSSTKGITVNNKPATPVISLSGNTLTSTSADTYQWHENDVEITGATSQTYEVSENGEYYVIITKGGCFSDPSNAIEIDAFSPPASTNPIVGESSVCVGSVYTYTVEPSANATAYNWTLPSGATGESTTNTIEISFTQSATSGDINVCASNVYGNAPCSEVAITVNPVPETPVITLSGNTLTSTSADTYQWHENDVEITGATSQTYEVSVNGEYYVKISKGGCFSEQSNVIVFENPTNIEVTHQYSEIVITPNPATNTLTIGDNSVMQSDLNVTIYDMQGRVVLHREIEHQNSVMLDISDLQRGIYMITVQSGKYNKTQKVLIQ
jgi:photosystem II stability/assembly factor-like uncharacterized protein